MVVKLGHYVKKKSKDWKHSKCRNGLEENVKDTLTRAQNKR